jgi:hypothetical protein
MKKMLTGTNFSSLVLTVVVTLMTAVMSLATSMANEQPQEKSVPPIVNNTSLSIQLGVNVGLLAVDIQVRNFYAFAAANLGVPLLTNGDMGAFAAGAGYTIALSRPSESMWFMDFLGIANPAWMGRNWQSNKLQAGIGLGAGVGLRYLHHSGFTLGLKLPLLGGFIYNGGPQEVSKTVGYFFLANAIALPVVSLGYRF